MPHKGQKLSPEHQEALRRSRLGVKASPETLERLRQSHLGKMTGTDNPRYGYVYTPEERANLRQKNLGKNRGNQHAKGYHHTARARERIGVAMKALWEQRRADPTLTPTIPMHPERAEGFTGQVTRGRWKPSQQRNYLESLCAFCGSTTALQLDHIIPRFMGGRNIRSNAQTLCEPCNHWKHDHIDRPQYLALLQAEQGAKT